MGLIANGFRDSGGLYMTFGATVSNNAHPAASYANRALARSLRNSLFGEGITNDLAGIPNGYREGGAWLMPQKDGALSSTNLVNGEGSLTGAIAEGRNLAATLPGTCTVNAILQLVVSGQALLNGTSTCTGNVLAAVVGSGSAAGTSTCSGTLGAKTNLNTSIVGSSDCTGIPSGLGWLIADITPYTELSPQSLSDAVWSAILSEYPDAGTAGLALATASVGGVDLNALAAAVVAALKSDPQTLTVPKYMGLQ